MFVTNKTRLSAATIAALYMRGWHVEVIFEWLKQTLRLQRFLRTRENDVKAQPPAPCPPLC